MSVRNATQNDALEFIKLRKAIFSETDFMLFEPNEYKPTEQQEKAYIKSLTESANSHLFFAVTDTGDIIGFLGADGGRTNRIRHIAHVFVGVLKQHWGQGIGKMLFASLFDWAGQNNIKRLELSTALNNQRAFKLYTGLGFEVEGIMKSNIMLNGELTDEYLMSYILS